MVMEKGNIALAILLLKKCINRGDKKLANK